MTIYIYTDTFIYIYICVCVWKSIWKCQSSHLPDYHQGTMPPNFSSADSLPQDMLLLSDEPWREARNEWQARLLLAQGLEMRGWWCEGDLWTETLDWLKGKSTGNHGLYHELKRTSQLIQWMKRVVKKGKNWGNQPVYGNKHIIEYNWT